MRGQLERLEAVSAVQLCNLVTQRLITWILDQGLGPGDKLPSERDLVDHLHVSRSVVREALTRLKALGVIETFQGRGSFIADVPVNLLTERLTSLAVSGRDMLQQVWEVREILETNIAGLAAERRTEVDVLALERAVGAMDAAIQRGSDAIAEDEQFHLALTLAAKNTVLAQLMDGVRSWIAATRRGALQRPGRPQTSNEEHRRILQAVREGNAGLARQLMREHLAYGRTLMVHDPQDGGARS